MKLQFDANQQYQLDAVRAVVDLFKGQPDASQNTATVADDIMSSVLLTADGVANQLVLTPEQLLANCQKVQAENGLPQSDALETMQLADGTSVGTFPNFTTEMETGTGKTYVYLRTIFELHKTYGFKKFVIVVPSVAIRAGVLKSLQITQEHFQTLYNHERQIEYKVYDSQRVNELRNFALSNAIQILVINIDAFAKDSANGNGATNGGATNGKAKKKSKGNVINQLRETGVRPIEFIQSTNPIVILDEPQNLETDIRKQALARLKPLCTLRYSATHRNLYNLIYKLDPVRAYELGLVKQIGVDSVVQARDANQAYVELVAFNPPKRSVTAKVALWVNQAGGPVKKTVNIKYEDNLYELSNQREIYKDGFIVNGLDREEGFIEFSNNVRVNLGQPHGVPTETILRLQMEQTIQRHLAKEKRLKPHGIKVLSVFFIDRVANYREYLDDGTTQKGKFALWFEEILNEYRNKPEYADLYEFETAQAHNGYFSQDKVTITPFQETNNKTNADAEASAFQLIMSDKERLLDPAEPLRFIFSHSALREGWDNPNVFQICVLREMGTDTERRQTVGRGLRLCVNTEGARVFDRNLNRLTVIASESFEDFAKQLQTEMQEAGVTFKKEMVQNERETVEVKLKKGYETDARFMDLWDKIRQRTRYRVHYDTAQLIAKAAKRMREQIPPIERPKIALTRAEINITASGVTGVETGLQTRIVEAKYVMPDFVGQISSKTSLSKTTVARILLESGRLTDAVNNPQLLIDRAADAINSEKRELLVSGVEYIHVDGLVYEMHRFENDDLVSVFRENVFQVQKQDKTLFSHILIDSNSGPERAFAQACENNEDVLFYIKLPKWFVIETPVGTYNPDWALMYHNDKTLYFVAETKYADKGQAVQVDLLRPIEQLKIECGKRHFKNFEQINFRVVGTLQELIAA